MKKSCLFIGVLSSLLLFSCNTVEEDGLVPVQPINDHEDISLRNYDGNKVAYAIGKLQNINNMTISVRDSLYSRVGKYYYTEDAFYNEINEVGYKEVEEGIFTLTNYNGDLRGGELLKDENGNLLKNLYTSNLLPNLNKFDFSDEDTSNPLEISIKSTSLRNAFIKFVGQDSKLLTEVKDFKISTDGETMNGLFFRMELEDGNFFSARISDIYETSITVIDEYMTAGNSYFVPNTEMKRARDLFNTDRYQRNIYAYNSSEEEIQVGKEVFTPNYFATLYDPEIDSSYAMYLDAYIGMQHQDFTLYNKDHSVSETRNLDGIYKCFVGYNTETKEYEVQPILNQAYVENHNDITQVLDYPKNWLGFSSFELFNYEEDTEIYFSNDYLLAASLYLNFQLYQVYSEVESLTIVGSGFKVDLAEKDEDSYVTLYLYMYVNGVYVYDSFEFTQFGKASVPALETITTEWEYTLNV